MTNTKNTPSYGLFYKSRGEWTGPYRNQTYTTLPKAQAIKAQAKRVLKSVVSIRKVS
jgi:hypothetical protein